MAANNGLHLGTGRRSEKPPKVACGSLMPVRVTFSVDAFLADEDRCKRCETTRAFRLRLALNFGGRR